MSEARDTILRMVASGRLTVEQASELLDAVETPGPPSPSPENGIHEHHTTKPHEETS